MKVQVNSKGGKVLSDGSLASRKLYKKGVHDLPDAVAKHWFTQSCFKSGSVSAVVEVKEDESSKPPEPKKKKE